MTWHDLSDGEVEARLIQRGVAPVRAARLVDRRDDQPEASEISRLLED